MARQDGLGHLDDYAHGVGVSADGSRVIVGGQLANTDGAYDYAVASYDAATGTKVADLQCGGGHWNSPIVADGRIALPEGSANSHSSSGILNIWRLP